MTAILDELRRLDAAHARGEISEAERDARRDAVIRSVPDANNPDDTAADPEDEIETPPLGMLHVVLLCLAIVGAVTGAATVLFVDFMLALTLGITILAALTVALFRQLEED